MCSSAYKDAMGQRLQRTGCRLILGWSSEQVTFVGRHYRVTSHQISPLPVQRPHPPVLIGGNGRQLLTLAA